MYILIYTFICTHTHIYIWIYVCVYVYKYRTKENHRHTFGVKTIYTESLWTWCVTCVTSDMFKTFLFHFAPRPVPPDSFMWQYPGVLTSPLIESVWKIAGTCRNLWKTNFPVDLSLTLPTQRNLQPGVARLELRTCSWSSQDPWTGRRKTWVTRWSMVIRC